MVDLAFPSGNGTLTNCGTFPGFGNFVGPWLLASMVNAFETGFIASQSSHFCGHSQDEMRAVKLCVAFVTTIAL